MLPFDPGATSRHARPVLQRAGQVPAVGAPGVPRAAPRRGTMKHVHFAEVSRQFRVRHDRVFTCTPSADEFSPTRDRADVRPEVFPTGDGWFAATS